MPSKLSNILFRWLNYSSSTGRQSADHFVSVLLPGFSAVDLSVIHRCDLKRGCIAGKVFKVGIKDSAVYVYFYFGVEYDWSCI